MAAKAPPLAQVGAIDDAKEREADSLAAQVMQMGTAGVAPADQRPGGTTQHRAAAEMQMPGTGAGRPLDGASRSFFEPRFGRSFSQVRVRTGPLAADSALSLAARAYTLGSDIVFGEGEYQPLSQPGRHLLAHELAHVALHDDGRIRREPYQTVSTNLVGRDVVALAATSYWEQRTLTAFATALNPRFNSNSEERDAVLSALWATNPPTTVATSSTRVLHVAARSIPATGGGTPTQAPELIYRVTFDPPATGQTRPGLTLEFIAAGPPQVAAAAPSFTPPASQSMNASDFPGGRTAYFAAHPDEFRDLMNWLTNPPASVPTAVNQIVTVQTTGTGGAAAHASTIHVIANRSPAGVTNLDLTLVAETGVGAAQAPDADYRARSGVDLELDRLRAATPVADRLGSITLPAGTPANERTGVNYAIWQYFASGSRNTEVDAIVPVDASRTALYTLTFGTNNDVAVLRLGPTGSGANQIATSRVDVTRVTGFPASPNIVNLRAWWAARYRNGGALSANSATPTPTVTTLIGEMNQLITAGIANDSWFNQNYQMQVLAAGTLITRLESKHHAPGPNTSTVTRPDMLTDVGNFDNRDRRMLELSLQTLGDSEIPHLQNVRLGRKAAPIERTSTLVYVAGASTLAGLTLTDSSGSGSRETTILLFDSVYGGNDQLFSGSTASNALPSATLTFVHELGHATEEHAGIGAAFATWLAAHPQAAPTWYAASNPADEFFPEAFALYHSDPHFLCTSAPLLYAWLDHLATTGSVPTAAVTATAASACPA